LVRFFWACKRNELARQRETGLILALALPKEANQRLSPEGELLSLLVQRK
jgi:hypothetical protein